MKFLEGKKTYIGLLVAIIPTIAGLFGYNLTPAGAAELGGLMSAMLDNVEYIITGVGTLIAAYGRLVTKAN